MRMQNYLSQVRHLQSGFESFNLQHIPRNGNTHADSLATLVTSSAQSLPRVILVEDLCKPTGMKNEVVHIHQIRVGPSWMDSIVFFLKENILPKEKPEADKVRTKAPPRIKIFISAIFLGRTCYAYTLRHQSYFWRSYMKEFLEATQE